MKGSLREKLYWQLPAWLWGLLIFVLTSLPKLSPPSLGFELEDKLYHLIVYAVWAFLSPAPLYRAAGSLSASGSNA